MRYTVEIDNELVPVVVRPVGTGRYEVQVGDLPARQLDASVHKDYVHLIDNLSSSAVQLGLGAQTVQAHLAGAVHSLAVLDNRTAQRRARERDDQLSGGASIVRSPMPGRIVAVNVSQGERVTKGQGVVIVEAMKMENELRAEIDGLVEDIHVKADDLVEGNATLITLTPSGDEAHE